MTSPTLQEKAAFFQMLDSLEKKSDSDDEEFREELKRRSQHHAFLNRPKKAQRETSQGIQLAQTTLPLKKTTSEPTPASTSRNQNIIESTPVLRKKTVRSAVGSAFIEESPIPDSAKTPQRSATNPLPSGKSLVTKTSQPRAAPKPSTGKRKRNSSDKVIPEADKLFKELSFYYIPNDNVAPLRKARISRAIDHGARWVRDLDVATHVIVDKKFIWKEIEMVFSSMEDVGSLTIVTDNYPLECVQFRQLCNPDQLRYKVSGCPIISKPRKGAAAALRSEVIPSSEESLKVTAAPQHDPEKWDYVPHRGTPPRGEESSVSNGGTAPTEVVVDSQPLPEHEDPGKDVVIPSSQDNLGSGKSIQERSSEQPGNRAGASSSSPQDELSEYIEMMRQYQGPRLEDEDQDLDDFRPSSASTEAVSDSNESDHESEGERSRKRRAPGGSFRSGSKNIAWEDRFACNQGGTKDTGTRDANPNARTIEKLQEMCDYYNGTNDHWRTTSYRKVISVLKRQTVKITTKEQACKLPMIGDRLGEHIEEIVTTDRLQRLEYAQMDPTDQVLKQFSKIYGVRNSVASKWIAQGYRTLDDLKSKAQLTKNQRIGIDHYDDLNSRIPRAEVEALGGCVKKAAAKIDPHVELLIGGSYRRGSDSSGDIDFVVTKKGTTSADDLVPFLEQLVSSLTKSGFLTAALASHHSDRKHKEGSGSKWHGCCVLPRIPGGPNDSDDYRPVWRRIDFLLVPETEYGAALIYFTGNDIFNRSIRLLASKKGMRLNQRGLYKDVMRGPKREKYTEAELLEGRDEKRIFEILGVKWRQPWERWC